MWHDIKQVVVDLTGFTPTILHIGFATIVFLAALAIVRHAWLAFATLAAFTVGNEFLDVIGDTMSGDGIAVVDAVYDVVVSLVAGLVVWGVVFLLRQVLQRRSLPESHDSRP